MRELSEGHEQVNHFVCSCGTPEERAAKRAEANPHGLSIDDLIWVLARTCYGVEIAADQWLVVICDGKYGKLDEDDGPTWEDGIELRTFVECDELVLGLAKTWEIWAEKFASVNSGRRPWVRWEPVIDERELRIDCFRGGVQAVNESDRAVRITHLPTGIVVSHSAERTQLQNKVKAIEDLREALREHIRDNAR